MHVCVRARARPFGSDGYDVFKWLRYPSYIRTTGLGCPLLQGGLGLPQGVSTFHVDIIPMSLVRTVKWKLREDVFAQILYHIFFKESDLCRVER